MVDTYPTDLVTTLYRELHFLASLLRSTLFTEVSDLAGEENEVAK